MNDVSERDSDLAYFGPEIADGHFLGNGPPHCYSTNEGHEWVNLPELARELDAAFGKHGFHAQAFMHVQNIDQCAACGLTRGTSGGQAG